MTSRHGDALLRHATEREIHDAIELRGTLEGLAARFAAEGGVSPMQLTDLNECSQQLEALTQGSAVTPEMFGSTCDWTNVFTR